MIHIVNRKGEKFDAIIDLEDFERVNKLNYSWYIHNNGHSDHFYVKATHYISGRKSRPVFLHRIIAEAQENDFVDHINGDTFNNRKSNLRVTTNSENLRNRKRPNKNSTSGHRNVAWDNTEKYWIVQLMIDGKNTALGRFKKHELDKAVEFAEEKRVEIYGEINA